MPALRKKPFVQSTRSSIGRPFPRDFILAGFSMRYLLNDDNQIKPLPMTQRYRERPLAAAELGNVNYEPCIHDQEGVNHD
jgi:hypothetical protein